MSRCRKRSRVSAGGRALATILALLSIGTSSRSSVCIAFRAVVPVRNTIQKQASSRRRRLSGCRDSPPPLPSLATPRGGKRKSAAATNSDTRLFSLNGDGDIPDLEFTDEADRFGGMTPKVYPQRWVQLLYLSLLALLSDWICFSVAAAPATYEAAYPGHSAASLIDIFLFTNVASCFLVTDTVSRFGLAKTIKGAAALMAAGCLLRSGVAPIFGFISGAAAKVGAGAAVAAVAGVADVASSPAATHTPSYPLMLAGTVLVGAAQPFFQCTPPLLSATWFGSDERATSTAVALNFNQIGIATAFLVGGAMAGGGAGTEGLANYFGLISLCCAVVTAGTFVQFADKPPSPPSSSEIEKLMKGEKEPPFFDSVKRFFSGTPGFSRALAAFICSISITNVVGAFIDEVLERGGIHEQLSIDLAGAGFELAILLGGIVIGGYVDRTKEYKSVTLGCLASTMFLLVPLGLTDHALGKEPLLLILSLLGLGMAVGPVQPINAELAVDVTYPSDETAVESVQQIGGNLVSALLVPVAEVAARQDYQLLSNRPMLESDVRGDVLLLMFVAIVTYAYFSGFDSPLKRTIADCGDDGTCSTVVLNRETLPSEGEGRELLASTKEELEKLKK